MHLQRRSQQWLFWPLTLAFRQIKWLTFFSTTPADTTSVEFLQSVRVADYSPTPLLPSKAHHRGYGKSKAGTRHKP
jgi:hypothetical protein